MQNSRSVYYLSLASLIILSGCWCKKSQDEMPAIAADDTSVVLLKLNGVPKITVNKLEENLNELAEMDQQIKMMLMFNPEETRAQVFQQQKRMAVIEEWASSNGIKNEADYKQKKAKIMEHIDKQLAFEQFLNHHKVEISEADLLDYYNQNKDQDYRILLAPAGIKSQAVEFSSKDSANKFLHKLKQSGVDHINKLAKEQKLFVRDLGNVNENSYADQAVKDAILNVSKLPSMLVVANKDQDKFWVVVAQSKETAQYHEFEKIKDDLRQMLMSKKIGEMLEAKVAEYAAKFDLVENSAYFDELKNNKKMAQTDMQTLDLDAKNESGNESSDDLQ